MPAELQPFTTRRFHRVLLKLSGEGLMGDGPSGLDPSIVKRLAEEIKSAHESSLEICLLTGGGNIFRGATGAEIGIDRANADYMGMLATVINALALGDVLNRIGCPTRVMSSLTMPVVCEPFSRQRALQHLSKKRVVIFAGGTGSPFFTTDTAAVLRAVEMSCDVLLKATQVDGVYTSDPHRNLTAQRYDILGYTDVLEKNLQVIDATAITLARENRLPVLIFSLHNTGSLIEILSGRGVYTIIR